MIGSANLTDGSNRAFTWQRSTGFHALPSLSSSTCDSANDVNAGGRIAGAACTAAGNNHAVYWN